MKELIKYFNDNYGSEYGNIDYPRTNKQIYSTYQIIKEIEIDDEKLDKLLKEIELPSPKTIEERDMHSECKTSITKDDVLDMLPCYNIEEIILSYTKEELDKLERVFEYSDSSTPSLKIPKIDVDNTFYKLVYLNNEEMITKEGNIRLDSYDDEEYVYYVLLETGINITVEKGNGFYEFATLDEEYFKKYSSLMIHQIIIYNSETDDTIELSYDDVVSLTIYRKEEKILDEKLLPRITKNLIPLNYEYARLDSEIYLGIVYPFLYELFKRGGYLHILIQGFNSATVDVSIPMGENILVSRTSAYNPDTIEGYRLTAISDICYYDTNGNLTIEKIILEGVYSVIDLTRINELFIYCHFKDNNGNNLPPANVDFVGVYFEECPFLPYKEPEF